MGTAFRKIQIGDESAGAEGTPVAATAILLGEISLENKPSLIRRAVPSILSLHGRQYLAQQLVGLRYSGDLTVEQICYLLEMGLMTATPVGTASPYAYTYTKAVSAAPTLHSYTIEYGDDIQAYEVNGCLVERVELSGAYGELCQMSADIFGWTRTATTFTGSLSVPTVNPLSGNYAKLFIDSTWATLGTNQLDAELIGWRLSLPTGIYPKWRKGTLYPSGHGIEPTAATLELRLEFTADAVTELAKVEAGTPVFIQVLVQKSANAILQIDGCYTYDPAAIFDADRGDNVLPLTCQSAYDSTGAKELEIAVTNTLAALP